MTVLDSFVTFAKALPAERLESIEDTLSILMHSYSAEGQFSAADLSELDRRVAEARPAFARTESVERLLAKKFPG
jgi:hypothetical protein